MINHHPSEATLVAFGAGGLAEGPALVVATHLAMCDACRDALRDIEALGGVLLDMLPPADMEAQSFVSVMSRLGETEPRPVPSPQRHPSPMPGRITTPEPLRSRLGGDIADLPWRALLPGIRYVEVMPRTPAGGNLLLLRVAPGMALGLHGHRGSEQTVILKGSYADELGRFRVGDFCETDDEISHRPVADSDDECICLICTDGPLRFAGWLARMMQPFIGI